MVEVEGTAGVGDFSPEIDRHRSRILGEAPLPVPRRVSGDELASGRQDSQWVEVEAVVRSAAERGTELTLNASAGAFQFRVFAPDYGTPPADLVDSDSPHSRCVCGDLHPGGAVHRLPDTRSEPEWRFRSFGDHRVGSFPCRCARSIFSCGSLRRVRSPTACAFKAS